MSVTVEVRKDGQSLARVELKGPFASPLLDALEACGLKMPFGCRAGSCGTCQVVVSRGGEHFEGRGPMEEDSFHNFGLSEPTRLACRARLKPDAQGEIVLELPKL